MGTELIAFAAMIAIAFPAGLTALAQSKLCGVSFESMVRQPGIGGKIQSAMIIALAMMEALTIYGLLVAIMLITKM